MLGVDCEDCGQHFPLSETAMVKKRYLCKSCTEKEIEAKQATWQDVELNIDATLCFHCKKDNGEHEFERVAGLGACPECTKFLRNRPFPTWVKAAIAGMLLFALGVGIYNQRFIIAYLDLKQCRAAAARGEYAKASALMDAGARKLPESRDLQVLAHYYRGMDLLTSDKGAEAYNEFCICCDMEPRAAGFQHMRSVAAKSKAFDEKNYDEYLRLVLADANKPGAVDPASYLAGAYACKYAVTRDEQYKAKALENLQKAKAEWGDDENESYDQFVDRMTHRMETGDIIKRSEFRKRYPDGYKASKEKAL